MATPTPIAIDAPLPQTVKRQYSFTDFSQNNPTTPPHGNRMDAEYDRINGALNTVINFCSEVKQLAPALTDPKAVAGADPTDLELDYAFVTQAWAEYMPGTIPPNILAAMNVTGDHWSSRWWANMAAQAVQYPGYGDPWVIDGSNSQVTLPQGLFGQICIRNTSGAPITVFLPGPPWLPGQSLNFKDALGNAGTYHITISGAVILTAADGTPLTSASGAILTKGEGAIDGASSYLMMSDYMSVEVFWMGDQWGTR